MWRGDKALNLAAIVVEKMTVGIAIHQLQVIGLILLFVFDGFQVQIRVLNLSNCSYFIITAGSHFLGKKLRPGMQVLA